MMPEMSDNSVDIEAAAEKALEDKELLLELLNGLTSKNETFRYNCFKVLIGISEENGEVLYPKWDYFAKLLKSANTHWKMSALQIIANITKVDAENRFDRMFDSYYQLLEDKSMIPSAHIAGNSAKIVRAKPALEARITKKLLDIDKTHDEPERKDLIKGYAIEAFSEYIGAAENKQAIIEFIKEQLNSQSPKTRKVAEGFLNKVGSI